MGEGKEQRDKRRRKRKGSRERERGSVRVNDTPYVSMQSEILECSYPD